MKSSGVQIVGVYVGLMYMEVSLRGSSNEVPGHLEEPFFWQAWEDMNSQRQASVPGANGGRTGGVEQRDQTPSTVWVRPGIALNLGSGGLKL